MATLWCCNLTKASLGLRALTCLSPPLTQLKSDIFIKAFHSSSQQAKSATEWESIYLNKNPPLVRPSPLESAKAEPWHSHSHGPRGERREVANSRCYLPPRPLFIYKCPHVRALALRSNLHNQSVWHRRSFNRQLIVIRRLQALYVDWLRRVNRHLSHRK